MEIQHLRPTLIYPTHEHPLCLKKKRNKDENIICNACYSYCEQLVACDELAHTESYILCCQNCNFKVHLLCGLLPHGVKHNCHVHPLTLFDSLVEDDMGEYYCDVCETERDPRICVYYCEKCKFIAHVHCVISEVVRILQGDCKDDHELRIVGQRTSVVKPEDILKQRVNKKQINNEGLKQEEEIFFTLEGLVRSVEHDQGTHNYSNVRLYAIAEEFNKEDGEDIGVKVNYLPLSLMIRHLTEKKQRINLDQKNNLIKRGDLNQEPKVGESIFQDKFSSFTFEELVRKLKNFHHPKRWKKITKNEMELKLVKVSSYVITWNLAFVLKDLLDKKGDISGGDNNELGVTFKSLIYFLVCRLLYNMSRTMVVDLTEDLLGDWYACMQFVEFNGFKIEFINYGLEQAVRNYFGLQASRAHENAIKSAKMEEKRLREEIAKLETKLKRYKEKLEEYEIHGIGNRLPSLETYDELVKECMNKASKIKWKYVTDCFY